jgi:hypothetical protein
MTGSFNSSEQARVDSNYLHINLEMKQIWAKRKDAYWLYVEQAAAWSMDEPYRQRVYKVFRNDKSKLESAVHELRNPKRFIGANPEDAVFNEISPDSLIMREGCSIILDFKYDIFSGSTDGDLCKSNLRGASYATSVVEITDNVLTSWDRGYNQDNEQVWGAEIGPYIFKKVKDY